MVRGETLKVGANEFKGVSWDCGDVGGDVGGDDVGDVDDGGGGDVDGDVWAEMEKAADAADKSVLFFSAGANF